jgi:cytochrome P450
MGRSERIWGPDAKEYKPSRWINTEKPSQGKFSAFHVGPRVCLGQQFATIEVMSVIGMILQSFEISLVEPSKKAQYGISLTLPMVDGLKIRVKRRSH